MDSWLFLLHVPLFREIIDEFFRLVPSDAGIRDGLAVAVLMFGLVAVFQIAFDHEAFDKVPDILGTVA